MSATVITYKRGKSYVQNTYVVKDRATKEPVMKDGKPVTAVAHGLVGELWVHGLMFQTIERMDGYMRMKGGKTYYNSSLYWMAKYNSFVINPWLGEDEKKQGNILLHPGGVASHVEGCVAVGFFNPKGVLEESKWCFEVLRDQAGGAALPRDTPVVVSLAVEGEMPALSACTPWVYEA
jgi:hypothetical protein